MSRDSGTPDRSGEASKLAAGPSRPADAGVIEAFRNQAEGCAGTGSPVYAELLTRAAEAMRAGGAFARLVEGYSGHPVLDALPIRVMGAIHKRVLSGRAPELAAHYPTAGGHYESGGAWRALEALVTAEVESLRHELLPVQTNEVLRCCALIGGFLEVAAHHRLPLRVLEVGASAGLLLGFDRYRYQLGKRRFGDPGARLALRCDWQGPPPRLDTPLRVISRRGCDPSPIDLRRDEDRQRLEPFVWADQVERLERLRAAMDTQREQPPTIDAEPAARWLPRVLADTTDGVSTVVFHSVVWWYLSERERQEVTATIEAAGRNAHARRPLAWLRMEGASLDHAEVRLRTWPGGEDVLLGQSHWHGSWVAWSETPR